MPGEIWEELDRIFGSLPHLNELSERTLKAVEARKSRFGNTRSPSPSPAFY